MSYPYIINIYLKTLSHNLLVITTTEKNFVLDQKVGLDPQCELVKINITITKSPCMILFLWQLILHICMQLKNQTRNNCGILFTKFNFEVSHYVGIV